MVGESNPGCLKIGEAFLLLSREGLIFTSKLAEFEVAENGTIY